MIFLLVALSREAAKLVRRSEESAVSEVAEREEFIRDVAKTSSLVVVAIDGRVCVATEARDGWVGTGLAEAARNRERPSVVAGDRFRLAREEVLVEGFGGGLVAERLAGAAVERGGDGLDLFCAPAGEVGALGEVLAQQPVGVLVAGALPGLCGSAK